MQTFMAAADSLGLCMMAGIRFSRRCHSRLSYRVFSDNGESLNENYLVNLGTSVLKLRGNSMMRCFTEKDDRCEVLCGGEAASEWKCF